LGFVSNGRLGPGKDEKDTGVYSINEVVAYVMFNNDRCILVPEVDQIEVATPNYDGDYMPHLTGFPGQSYNADENDDEQADLDVVSGATMSLRDAHGHILGAIGKSWANAKATDITVEK